MADSAIKTWGQRLDYTFQTRHSWRHGNGSKTARINTSHFAHLRGHSFPLSKITDANVGIRIVQELLGCKTIEATLRCAKASSKARNDAIHSI